MTKIIDLRSDTVTVPSNEMLNAMLKASFGDDFYVEDHSTNRLEEYCAKFFNKESALFMASGTLANQVAIRSQTQPGDDVVIDSTYHINYYESAQTADLAKVSLNTVHTTDGVLDVDSVEKAIWNKHRSDMTNGVSLICVENTINFYSGKIFPLEALSSLYGFAKLNRLNIHLDGARLLNASVATGIPADVYAEYTDSLMISFSKGLGAPFGAILLGSQELISRARRYRKWYGGGLHQSGMMAEAALYAMKNNIQQLAIDNHHAKLFAEYLARQNNLSLQVKPVESNIVMFSVQQLGILSRDFVSMARKNKVLLYPWDKYTVRAVMHKNINDPDLKIVEERLDFTFSELLGDMVYES